MKIKRQRCFATVNTIYSGLSKADLERMRYTGNISTLIDAKAKLVNKYGIAIGKHFN